MICEVDPMNVHHAAEALPMASTSLMFATIVGGRPIPPSAGGTSVR